MKAAGKLAWINQYSVPSDEILLQRAKDVRCIIVKYYLSSVTSLLKANKIPFAVENYVLPDNLPDQAQNLINAYNIGAEFIVLNAEVEWEDSQSGPKMQQLINLIKTSLPDVEIYASIDTRGDRLNLPYQQVMLEQCTGVMPMIYPEDFYPDRPPGFVAVAFRASLDGRDFKDKPVLPTIQTYDNIGPEAVRDQITEVKARGLPGYQAYTLGHATDDEWKVIAEDRWEDEMTEREEEIRYIYLELLFREPETGGLKAYTLSNLSLEQIRTSILTSGERMNIARKIRGS